MFKTPRTGVVLVFLAAIALASPVGAVRTAPDAAVSPIGSFKDAVAGGDATRPGMDFTDGQSRASDLPLDAVTPLPTAPMPLSQVAGGARAPLRRGAFGLWDIINQVRYGGLPEPASWALMLIGFGMIGGALRGFMLANRRLAGLQPEDSGEAEIADDGA